MRLYSTFHESESLIGTVIPPPYRVAKALETYDSVMVRRDLEAEGGFAEFFRRPDEPEVIEPGTAVATHAAIDSGFKSCNVPRQFGEIAGAIDMQCG